MGLRTALNLFSQDEIIEFFFSFTVDICSLRNFEANRGTFSESSKRLLWNFVIAKYNGHLPRTTSGETLGLKLKMGLEI